MPAEQQQGRGSSYLNLLIAIVLAAAITVIAFLATQRERPKPSIPQDDAAERILSTQRQGNPQVLNLPICYAIDNRLLVRVYLAPKYEGDAEEQVVLQPYAYGVFDEDGKLHLAGYPVDYAGGFFGTLTGAFGNKPTGGMVKYPVSRIMSVQAIEMTTFSVDATRATEAKEGLVATFCMVE